MNEHDPKITKDRFHEMLGDSAPFMDSYDFQILDIGYGTASVAVPYNPGFIRPGGTIAGPVMFAAADFTLWVAVLGAYGEVPLAVTTNMAINFLRKPENETLIADARLFKIGKRLAVGDIWVSNKGVDEPCAHVTGTYSIPPMAK